MAEEGLEDKEVMDKVDKIQTKLKFAAFGKTKPRTERTRENIKAAADRPEAEESKDILKRQAKLIEEQVNKVKKTANSRVTKIFRMKELVAGNLHRKHRPLRTLKAAS